MRVWLVNVDCRWNLALRRLYAWHEQRGDEVEMRDLNFGFYQHNKREVIDGRNFDTVYISNIFETNADRVSVVGCADVRRGGGWLKERCEATTRSRSDTTEILRRRRYGAWVHNSRLHTKLLFLQGAKT